MEKDIKQAMYQKSQNIAEAQKRKNDAIQIAGLQRDATLLTVAQMGNSGRDAEDIAEAWNYWHGWLKNKLDNEILGF